MIEEETIQHPSFGCIGIHRISGHSGYLFGSNVQPDNFIEIELTKAEETRDLCTSRVHGRHKPLFRVKMSPAQFAEFITTSNCGSGSPCTIVSINGEDIPQVSTDEVENRKDFVQRKFKERMVNFKKELTERQETIKAILKKQSLSKKDKEEINNLIYHMNMEIASNIPYFATCFQETMDQIVLDAKCEVDAAIQHRITKAGLEALKIEAGVSNNKMLE